MNLDQLATDLRNEANALVSKDGYTRKDAINHVMIKSHQTLKDAIFGDEASHDKESKPMTNDVLELQSTLPCATTLPVPIDKIDLDSLGAIKLSSYEHPDGVWRIGYAPKAEMRGGRPVQPFDEAYLSSYAFSTEELALSFVESLKKTLIKYLEGTAVDTQMSIAESDTKIVADSVDI